MIEQIKEFGNDATDKFETWKEQLDKLPPEAFGGPLMYHPSEETKEKIHESFKNGYDSVADKTKETIDGADKLSADIFNYTQNLTSNVASELKEKTPKFDYETIGKSAAEGAKSGAVVGGGIGAFAGGVGAVPGGMVGGLSGGISGATSEVAYQVAKHYGASEGLASSIKFGTEVVMGLGAAKVGLASVGKETIESVGETKAGEIVAKQYDDVLRYSQDKIKTAGFEAKGLVNNLKTHEFIDGNGKVFVGKIDDIIDMSRTIKMPYIGSNLDNANSAGFLRDKVQFSKEYLEKYPETMSAINVDRIKNNLSPIVDNQWIKFNPNHKTFLGQTLEHHHISNTGIAAYVPQGLHRGVTNKDALHVDNMVLGWDDFKNIMGRN